jgi:RNA-binding protein YlmH
MEEQLLAAKVRDALRLCDTTGMFKAVGFLSPAEASFVSALPEVKNSKYTFFGGYEDAERVYFIAMPDWCNSPEETGLVNAFTFTYRKCDKLTHRDFLGTLMSLGIVRETVGDILCEEGRTVVFVSNSVSSYISGQIEKVGGVGVAVTPGFNSPLPCFGELKEFTSTIASLRLDCVVAALLNTSREKAKEVILEKRVSVNSVVSDKTTLCPSQFAKISIKGVGRFVLSGATEHTKKGRIILNYKKYV